MHVDCKKCPTCRDTLTSAFKYHVTPHIATTTPTMPLLFLRRRILKSAFRYHITPHNATIIVAPENVIICAFPHNP